MAAFEKKMIEMYGQEPLSEEEKSFVAGKLSGLFADTGTETKEIPVWQQRKLLQLFKKQPI